MIRSILGYALIIGGTAFFTKMIVEKRCGTKTEGKLATQLDTLRNRIHDAISQLIPEADDSAVEEIVMDVTDPVAVANGESSQNGGAITPGSDITPDIAQDDVMVPEMNSSLGYSNLVL